MTALPAPPQQTDRTVRPPRLARRRRSGVFERFGPLVHRLGLTALRGALGVVYVWFGALKIAGISPATDLVTGTVPWPTPSWFVAALGWFEVGLGLWLVLGRGMKWALPLFVAHMIGTMGVLVMMPQAAYQHSDPLALTMVGEFVVKNLVLLTAGVVVATRSVATRSPAGRSRAVAGSVPAAARPGSPR